MKIKKLLIAFSGLALAFGTALGIGLNNENQPQEVKAETSTADTGLIIGLNDNAHNFAEGCVIAVEYYGASNRTVQVDQIGDYLYSATLPAGTTGFNVYRLDSGEVEYLPYDGAPAEGKRYNIFNYTYDSTKNMVMFDYSNFSTHEYKASDRTVVPAGTRYIYHHDSTSWIGDWFQSGASPRLVTFANNYYGTYKQFIEMHRISDSQFMEVTLDKALCLDNYYYARLNPEVAVGDGAVWSQTTDITINRTGGLIMGLTTGTDGKVDWANSNDNDHAELWGAVFMDNVTCSGSGSISSADWTRVRDEYLALSNTQQGIVWNATGSISGSTYLSKGIYRYDYIVLYKKAKDASSYSAYTDFINRKDSPNKTTFSGAAIVVYKDVSDNSSNSSLVIVAVSAAITLLAFGGYFFLRKKHQ